MIQGVPKEGNTHDCNNEKPYELGFETLTGKLMLKKSQSSIFSFTEVKGEENVFIRKTQSPNWI